MKSNASKMAMGGVFAALAVVIMNLGGLIPVATYVCPMLCMLLLRVVAMYCGNRTAWAWYGAVAILGMLMSPDKEAAAVFLVLGYYPIVKPWLDTLKLRLVWKGLLFNTSVIALYAVLIRVMGVEQVTGEEEALGNVMLAVLLILGNVTFAALDRLLTILQYRLGGKR